MIVSVYLAPRPTANGEIGHRTGRICHLNNIAMLLGRKLKWDPAGEQVLGDDSQKRRGVH